jgi:DNA-binding response OmpR family regulator
MRGALISRVLEKNGFKVYLHKNIREASDIINTRKPNKVIVDKEGYFPSELSYFTSLSSQLNNSAVLFVSDSSVDDSIWVGSVPMDWCVSNPMDLQLVTSKALKLLSNERPQKDFKHLLPDIEKEPPQQEEKVVLEDETLEKDLMGFIGLK